MNCPKCNAPLKEGDEFCCVCGSLVENNNKVSKNINQVSSQLANNVNHKQPKKSNNVVLYILIVVIVGLIGTIVFLFLYNRNNIIDTNTEEENTSVNTTSQITVGVADYSISLPNGYALSDYQSSLIFYNTEETITGYISSSTGLVSNMTSNAETVIETLQSYGVINITYEAKTLNDKNSIIFSGEYSDYYVDIIYIQSDDTNVICGEVYYTNTTVRDDNKFDVEEIISSIVVNTSSYQTTSVLDIDLSSYLTSGE